MRSADENQKSSSPMESSLKELIDQYEDAMRNQIELEFHFKEKNATNVSILKVVSLIRLDPKKCRVLKRAGIREMCDNWDKVVDLERRIQLVQDHLVHQAEKERKESNRFSSMWDSKSSGSLDRQPSTDSIFSTVNSPMRAERESRSPRASFLESTRMTVSGRNEVALVSDSSSKLSVIWVNRMKRVGHSRGYAASNAGGDKDNDDNNNSVLILKPKWPEWLGDISYDVVKTNRYGLRQNRTVKFTQYHVLNIRQLGEVSRAVNYERVTAVWLKDPSTLVITYSDSIGSDKSKRQLTYTSSVAIHIAHQLESRLEIRRDLEKSGFGLCGVDGRALVGYSVESIAMLMESLGRESNANTMTTTDNGTDMLGFAMELGKLALSRAKESNSKLIASRRPSTTTAKVGAVGVMGSSSPLKRKDLWKDDEVKAMVQLGKDTNEAKLQNAIQLILSNHKTTEGKSKAHFISNFDVLQSSLVDIRCFVEGLQSYMVSNRFFEFLDILKQGLPVNADHFDEDKRITAMCFICYTVIEELIITSMREDIDELLASDAKKVQQERAIKLKIASFSERPQGYWGVRPDCVSMHCWQTAVFEMAGLDRNATPTRRLHSLTMAANAVYTEYKAHVLPSKKSKDSNDNVLSADDLVPIFVFIITQCNLRNPLLNTDLLWELCHPDQLHGEPGYYLTLYESAVQYIVHFDENESQKGTVEE
jgi:hypothetical protein